VSAERPGIVDLGELSAMFARRGPTSFHARSGLDVEPTRDTQSFAPPRVVILYGADTQLMERARGWLADAEHVLLAPPRESDADVAEAFREVVEHVVREREEAIERASAEPCADIEAAIARALQLASALPSKEPAPVVSVAPDDELPASSWMPFEAARPEFEFLERVERRGNAITMRAPRPYVPPNRTLRPGVFALGADPIHPISWRGDRMTVHWYFKGHYLCRSEHGWPCGPAKKLYGYKDNDPVQVCVAPDTTTYVERFEHDALVAAVPFAWHRAGDVDVALRPFDPCRALFFAQDEANDVGHPRTDPSVTIDDEEARDLAPAIVLAPDHRYALSLEHRTYRIDVGGAASFVGGPNEGFAVFERDHTLVRRGIGRLLGGWYRHATIEENGHYFREDLATGERTLLGPVDFEHCADEAVEAVARDAMLEGNVERARALRRSAGLVSIPNDDVTVLALQGTRNVLLVAKGYVRVV
jgi:hypothetical protein